MDDQLDLPDNLDVESAHCDEIAEIDVDELTADPKVLEALGETR